MSLSGPYADGPNQIRYEGQQITLQFNKLSDSEGMLTWNLPKSVTGCSTSAVYNGAVIVGSTKPILLEHKPSNGERYNGDSTVNPSLHSGSKLDQALVIFGSYDDVITTQTLVTDLDPNETYHFALFAVTAQLEYDRAGSHAYSTAAGKDSHGDNYPAYHEYRVLGPANKKINIKDHKFIQPSMLGEASTSLQPDEQYTVNICHNEEYKQFTFTGAEAATWDQLVNVLNLNVALLQEAPHLNTPPNVGALYVDQRQQTLGKWSGEAYVPVDVAYTPHDPSYVLDGTYYHVDGSLLHRVAGAWVEVDYVTSVNRDADVRWFNGDCVNVWNGTTWCITDTYISETDPTASKLMPHGCHWYNTDTGIMSVATSGCWSPVNALYWSDDPNHLEPDTLWLNDETMALSRFTGVDWEAVEARVRRTACKDPIHGEYWIHPNGQVKQYSAIEAKWDAVSVLNWSTDPSMRDTCNRWWDARTDQLHVWNVHAGEWTKVECFKQQNTDPQLSQTPKKGSHWLNGSVWNVWDGMDWVNVNVVSRPTDPFELTVGEVSYDAEVDVFAERQPDGTLLALTVIKSNLRDVTPGQYWYNPVVDSLNVWIGTSWLTVPHSTTPHIPSDGSMYFDIPSSTLMVWAGYRYVPATLPYTFGVSQYNNLAAVTNAKGSTESIKVTFSDNLVKSIKPRLVYLDPVGGEDGIPVKPLYKIEGIGTDGSEDERRELANYVLSMLGYPTVQVELTKMQLDFAIDDALEVLRLRTSSAYKRAYVVVDLFPNQQAYTFANRSSQLDRVVRVIKLHRTKFGRIGAYSYEDTFGHAMVQQLYYAGSFDILSYHLLAQYNEMINMVFANDITFSWSESDRLLMLQQTIRNKERILAEVELEKTEQELIRDRVLRNWVKKYTLGKSMLILAQPRGKFASLAGAGGGVSLNAADLQTQGQQLIDECNSDIDNGIIGSMDQYGSSLIMMG